MGTKGLFAFTSLSGLIVPMVLQLSYSSIMGDTWGPFVGWVYFFASLTTAILSFCCAMIIPKKLHDWRLDPEETE
jgi:hypothetical protein